MKATTPIKQSTFVAKYENVWQAFDELCQATDAKGNAKPLRKLKNKQSHYPLVALYRQICEHYALACQRNYSPMLIDELHKRVMTGHRLIHYGKKSQQGRFLTFVFYTFPQAVRAEKKLFWLCFALFYVPCVAMGVGCYLNDELIYSVMSHTNVYEMEAMYDPANRHIGRESSRASDTDLMMFGHYVQNNIGIDFKTYALGLFFGIGTVLITLYNGFVIGAVAGHLTNKGFSETFWSFVASHGSFELTALVISTMAGLKLATPLIAPAPYSRKDAFLVAGRESVVLILGAGLMTFIAAFIEAFWSSQSYIPNEIKYLMALFLWSLVAWYLLFCGKPKVLGANGENGVSDET